MSTYAHPESLVSTQWVTEHLEDPAVRIVEVVWGSKGPSGMEVYEANHIPGAEAWDYQDDYFCPEDGDVADKKRFEKQLSRSGIQSETTIVLYGGSNNMNATFEFWLLKVYGHQKAFLLSHNCLGSPPVPPNIGFQPTRYATRAAEPCRWANFSKCGNPRRGEHQGIDRYLGRHVP